MKFLAHRSRVNYWSSSKLSLYIRRKFGLTNPKWNTMEGWDDHEDFCQTTSPKIHWVTDTGFNKLQDIWLFLPDLWWTFKHADIWKFFRNLWLFRKCLWNYRSWDYSGLLYFMETCAKDMSHCHKNHGHLMKSERTAKDLLIFAEHIKRVRKDDWMKDKVGFVKTGKKGLFGGHEFIQKANTLPNYNRIKTFCTIEKSVKENHLKEAAKIFEKKVLSFWD